MQDLVGNEITIGCLLAYPGRKRSKLWLSCIRVHVITAKAIVGMNLFGRQVTIKNLDQLVVVNEPRL